MRFLKSFLLVFCFFIYGERLLATQNPVLTIDSIIHHGVNSVLVANIDSGVLDSLIIYTHLTNNDTVPIYLLDTSLSLEASISGSLLDTAHFTYTLPDTEMFPGNSTRLTLKMFSLNGNPLPNLVPTGSSVVIWPVYDSHASIDSAGFIIYQINTAAVNDLKNIYNTILYNSQFIHITFGNAAQRVLQLFDATGRKVYEGENNSNNDEIDWSALPASIYILCIRQGDQNAAIKLVHF